MVALQKSKTAAHLRWLENLDGFTMTRADKNEQLLSFPSFIKTT